jgi:hypothetical protein
MAAPNTPSHNLSAPPCSVDVRVTLSACSISGNPPFKATKTYTCASAQPTWFLITLYSKLAHTLGVQNPNHPKNKDSRVGPFPSFAGDGWGQEKLDLEDSELVRLEPGEQSETGYVFRIKLMRWSSGRSDVRNMKVF